MAELLIPVLPTEPIQFDPTQLKIVELPGSVLDENQPLYFELSEDAELKPGMTQREWVDRGNIDMPKSVLSSLRNSDGTLNVAAANQILAGFKLSVNETQLAINEGRALPDNENQPPNE